MSKKKVREVALEILVQIEKNQAYSNLLLNQMIKKHGLERKDTGLLTEIVYGTIQRKLTLDYYLAPFLKKSKKLQDWVLVLLRLSLYQMVYLDRVPERAAIHEAVEIAKRKGHKGISGLVNGVLRSVQREGLPSVDEINDPVKRISIQTSHPEWLVKRWIEQFGETDTFEMCSVNLTPPPVTARVNQINTTINDLITSLKQEGIEVAVGDLSVDSIKSEGGNLANTSAYKNGYLTIQDESSMLVARALGVEKNQTVLDACAAPGGKTTHIAELLQNTGKVISVDLHAHKVKLINDQIERLALTNVETKVNDSRKLQDEFEHETFDRVLVDAPCSGFGVMRRKPDIKYSKQAEDVRHLAKIQGEILQSVACLVKPGGILVYSTCTIDKEENEDVVKQFIEKHPEFELDHTFVDRVPEKAKSYVKDGQLQIMPHYFGSDGFFIASLRKQV